MNEASHTTGVAKEQAAGMSTLCGLECDAPLQRLQEQAHQARRLDAYLLHQQVWQRDATPQVHEHTVLPGLLTHLLLQVALLMS